MGFIRLFLGLRGRLSRAEFLIMGLLLGAIEEVARTLVLTAVEARYPDTGQLLSLGPVDLASNGVMIVFLWPTLCMMVKRYHDLDKSGWWALLIAAPIVLGTLGVVSYLEDAKDSGILLCALAAVAFVWPMIELGTFQGSSGDNSYGPRLGWKSLFPGLAKYLVHIERDAVAAMASAAKSTPAKPESQEMPISRQAQKPTRRPRPAMTATAFGQRANLGR